MWISQGTNVSTTNQTFFLPFFKSTSEIELHNSVSLLHCVWSVFFKYSYPHLCSVTDSFIVLCVYLCLVSHFTHSHAQLSIQLSILTRYYFLIPHSSPISYVVFIVFTFSHRLVRENAPLPALCQPFFACHTSLYMLYLFCFILLPFHLYLSLLFLKLFSYPPP